MMSFDPPDLTTRIERQVQVCDALRNNQLCIGTLWNRKIGKCPSPQIMEGLGIAFNGETMADIQPVRVCAFQLRNAAFSHALLL